MSITIKHPEGATGSFSGIEFEGGTAKLDTISDEARAILEVHGYTFEGTAAPKLTAAEKKAADAEAKRIAALPIHAGDFVKFTEAALGVVEQEGDGPKLESASAWRGTVRSVYAVTVDGDDVADVSTDDEELIVKINDLEVAPPQ